MMKKPLLFACAIIASAVSYGQPSTVQINSIVQNVPLFELKFYSNTARDSWLASGAGQMLSEVFFRFMRIKMLILAAQGREQELGDLASAAQQMFQQRLLSENHTNELQLLINNAPTDAIDRAEEDWKSLLNLLGKATVYLLQVLPGVNLEAFGTLEQRPYAQITPIFNGYLKQLRDLIDQKNVPGLVCLAMKMARERHTNQHLTIFFDAMRFATLDAANILRLELEAQAIEQTSPALREQADREVLELLELRHVDGLARLYARVDALYQMGYLATYDALYLRAAILNALDRLYTKEPGGLLGIRSVSQSLMMRVWGTVPSIHILAERFAASSGVGGLHELLVLIDATFDPEDPTAKWLKDVVKQFLMAHYAHPDHIQELIDFAAQEDVEGVVALSASLEKFHSQVMSRKHYARCQQAIQDYLIQHYAHPYWIGKLIQALGETNFKRLNALRLQVRSFYEQKGILASKNYSICKVSIDAALMHALDNLPAAEAAPDLIEESIIVHFANPEWIDRLTRALGRNEFLRIQVLRYRITSFHHAGDISPQNYALCIQVIDEALMQALESTPLEDEPPPTISVTAAEQEQLDRRRKRQPRQPVPPGDFVWGPRDAPHGDRPSF